MEFFLRVVALLALYHMMVLTSAETYYAIPSSSTPCPEEGVPCFTLSQYANKTNDYFASNTTLILLPGNHRLDSVLSIQNISFLSVESLTTTRSDTSITCRQSARFTFESINVVSMRGLVHFGCVNNNITRVEEFTLEDCSLDGQGRNGTGLQLNEVSTANITRSSFSSNTGGVNHSIFEKAGGAVIIINSILGITISDCTFQNNTVTGNSGGGGTVFVVSSPITIINTSLNNSTVTVTGTGGDGGAVYAISSPSITVANSTLNSNTVTGQAGGAGGALYAISSPNITIVNSTLNNNMVTGFGGAVYASSSPINIVNSTLNNNTVTGDSGVGGAVYAVSSPNITIVNSALINNTVTGGSGYGGAVVVVSSPIKIVNSTLNNNTVTGYNGYGGAIFILSSPINVVNSTLNNNTVTGYSVAGGAVVADSSPISIVNSTLNNNTVTGDSGYGGAVFILSSPINVVNSTLNNNTVTGYSVAGGYGGAVYAVSSPNITIVNSALSNNTVTGDSGCGGAVVADSSHINIVKSTLNSNTVTGAVGDGGLGGAVYAVSSPIAIVDTTLNNNTAFVTGNKEAGGYGGYGGAVYAISSSSITIVNSSLNSNTVTGQAVSGYGGAVYAAVSNPITIVNSSLNSNTVTGDNGAGGAVYALQSPITIVNSSLNSNSVTAGAGGYGGVLYALSNPISIVSSTLNSNTVNGGVAGDGGAVYAVSSPITIIVNSSLNSNTVTRVGGAVYASSSPNITIVNSTLNSNTVTGAGGVGGAVYASNSILNLGHFNSIATADDPDEYVSCTGNVSVFQLTFVTFSSCGGFLDIQNNKAATGVLYALQSTLFFSGNTTVSNNHGSLFVYSCNVTFMGHIDIVNNSNTTEGGGALTAFQSEIVFMDRVNLMYNSAIRGGAIAATQSKLNFFGDITISHNTALESGGGIYAYQSELNFKSNITISGNSANIRGGGIHAISSITRLTDGSEAYIGSNHAERGGGMCLEISAKIYLLKSKRECPDERSTNCISNTLSWITLHLDNNTADYGGAVYVADDTTSATCSATPFSDSTTIYEECFLQGISLYGFSGLPLDIYALNTVNTGFIDNSATVAGDLLYGGLLDRCRASPFAEVFISEKYNSTPSSLSAESYLLNITNLQVQDFNSTKMISSDPVRVCFCKNNQSDCSYHPQPKYVRKGEMFTVSLVAVDHVNNSIANSTIHAFELKEARLGEGQSIQQTSGDGSCTDLVYSIVSPDNSEKKLHLYADGPCMNTGISTVTLTVNIAPCPIGFENNDLRCECDPILSDSEFISDCSIDSETVERKDNVWFSYLNTTDRQGLFLLHKHCPFDYCYPPTENISVNLNIENGANELCAFNRSGKLCGSCEDGLSLSLGSSHCRPCSNNWLALLIIFAVAGVALVAFILKLNFTVAEGTFNGLIFYANIFAANSAIFFLHDETKILTVFIAWLNLDFGIETCFYDGLDSYAKTWLQFAFPLYVISLVVAIIVISDYSTKFARLFTGKNPIATLATLILLSYTKLLRTIIASLSFTTIQYSDGSREVVWLIDANIPYFSGKHIPLFFTALVIAILGITYTSLLSAWQWLVYCPNRGPLKWIISNTKVIAFMDAYHNPYNKDHRYWIGLLLLVRVVLYLISAVNVLGDPHINLCSIALTIVILLVFQHFVEANTKVQKYKLNDLLEIASIINLICLTIITFFITEDNNGVTYTSTSIAFILFLIVLVYHMYMFVFKEQSCQKVVDYFKQHLLPGAKRQDDRTIVNRKTVHVEDTQPVSETEFNALPESFDVNSIRLDNDQVEGDNAIPNSRNFMHHKQPSKSQSLKIRVRHPSFTGQSDTGFPKLSSHNERAHHLSKYRKKKSSTLGVRFPSSWSVSGGIAASYDMKASDQSISCNYRMESLSVSGDDFNPSLEPYVLMKPDEDI